VGVRSTQRSMEMVRLRTSIDGVKERERDDDSTASSAPEDAAAGLADAGSASEFTSRSFFSDRRMGVLGAGSGARPLRILPPAGVDGTATGAAVASRYDTTAEMCSAASSDRPDTGPAPPPPPPRAPMRTLRVPCDTSVSSAVACRPCQKSATARCSVTTSEWAAAASAARPSTHSADVATALAPQCVHDGDAAYTPAPDTATVISACASS
jgi:hypothetical protein